MLLDGGYRPLRDQFLVVVDGGNVSTAPGAINRPIVKTPQGTRSAGHPTFCDIAGNAAAWTVCLAHLCHFSAPFRQNRP